MMNGLPSMVCEDSEVGFDVHSWTPAALHTLLIDVAARCTTATTNEMPSIVSDLIATLERGQDGRVTNSLRVMRQGDRFEEDEIVRRPASIRRSETSIVSESDAVKRALELSRHVAPTGATVLLLGETGVGKEVFAEHIHSLSSRRLRPMVKVNCAAIPATLLENELFGHERGAFTDAVARQAGRFEAAHGSTIFLDEIGELPRDMQVKLLRVLQERTIERIGGGQTVKVDVRVIAATNCDLDRAVRDGTFREDLYYRLNVFPVRVPALRERVADLPGLLWTFIDELAHTLGRRIDAVSKQSLRDLERYGWPGNIRELRNLIEREMIQATSSTLTLRVPESPVPAQGTQSSATQVSHLRAVLDSCGWRIRGPQGAAERLNMKPTTLESRIARLGLSRREATLPASLPGSLG
jgi:transcriptional regulator with GAF, ATPase, and Fis domain